MVLQYMDRVHPVAVLEVRPQAGGTVEAGGASWVRAFHSWGGDAGRSPGYATHVYLGLVVASGSPEDLPVDLGFDAVLGAPMLGERTDRQSLATLRTVLSAPDAFLVGGTLPSHSAKVGFI